MVRHRRSGDQEEFWLLVELEEQLLFGTGISSSTTTARFLLFS